jgi:hypothetical protein
MLKKIIKYPLSTTAIFALFFLFSCGKNETETLPNRGADYYPLALGNTAIFDLDSVIYDPVSLTVSRIDTYRWQAREILTDTFRPKAGNLSYIIDRAIRPKTTSDWLSTETFSTALTPDYVLLSENNLTYIKFPTYFDTGTTWNGNVFNDTTKIIIAGELLYPFSKKWTFEVLSYGKPEKIGAKDYADVLTVRAQSDPNIFTEKRYSLEKYAKGVGLVYREIKILDSQKNEPTVAWEKKAQQGFILKMTRTN